MGFLHKFHLITTLLFNPPAFLQEVEDCACDPAIAEKRLDQDHDLPADDPAAGVPSPHARTILVFVDTETTSGAVLCVSSIART